MLNQPFQDSETPKKLSNDDLALDLTKMAKYRSRAAADHEVVLSDRTLMVWIRISLSLIGFCFGIPYHYYCHRKN